jgi:hypothetical protein
MRKSKAIRAGQGLDHPPPDISLRRPCKVREQQAIDQLWRFGVDRVTCRWNAHDGRVRHQARVWLRERLTKDRIPTTPDHERRRGDRAERRRARGVATCGSIVRKRAFEAHRPSPTRQAEKAPPLETYPIFSAEQHHDRRVGNTEVIAGRETKRALEPPRETETSTRRTSGALFELFARSAAGRARNGGAPPLDGIKFPTLSGEGAVSLARGASDYGSSQAQVRPFLGAGD